MLNKSMKTSNCQSCSATFTVKPGTYGKFCSLSCSSSYNNKHIVEKRTLKYNLAPSLCFQCQKSFSYAQRNNKFCSSSCSAKTTNKLTKKRGPTPVEKFPYCKIKFIFCEHTKQWYSNKNPNGTTRKTSPYTKTLKEKYYRDARFKFNVYQYPTEFNLDLIDTHGWYTCPGKKRKNKIKNILGVSRDHIMSVSYGFKHNIDPAIISHPTNCRIILHTENKKKHNKCDITLDQLLQKIDNWNKKYTERATGIEPATNSLEG